MWKRVGARWEYRDQRGYIVARVSPTPSGWRWETSRVEVIGGYLRFAVVAQGSCPGGAGKEGRSFLKAQGLALAHLNSQE